MEICVIPSKLLTETVKFICKNTSPITSPLAQARPFYFLPEAHLLLSRSRGSILPVSPLIAPKCSEDFCWFWEPKIIKKTTFCDSGGRLFSRAYFSQFCSVFRRSKRGKTIVKTMVLELFRLLDNVKKGFKFCFKKR